MLLHYWNIGTFKLLHADWLSDRSVATLSDRSVATLTSLHDWSVATFPSLHNWSVATFLSLHKAQLECCHIYNSPQLECCHIPITPLVLQHSFHSTSGVWPHSWWRLLHDWSVTHSDMDGWWSLELNWLWACVTWWLHGKQIDVGSSPLQLCFF